MNRFGRVLPNVLRLCLFLRIDPIDRAAFPQGCSPRKSPLAQSKQIPLRPILVGPCIVGFWEYDPDKQRVVHATFAKTAARAALSSAAESLTAFLRDKLQHGRSFSLDTDAALDTRATLIGELSG